MGIQFSADEIFKVAERIEANGAAFYRQVAELQQARGIADVGMLTRFAEMEDDHQAIFAAMRADLTDQMREETAADPYMEAAMYLQQLADTHGGEGAVSVVQALKGDESMAEILGTAIALEEKSIVFYTGLLDMVPPKLGKDKVEAIIAEEKNHVTVLAGELRALQEE